MQYRQIEIDVDVNKWLESKRNSFDQTHNDILRAEAGLSFLPRSSGVVVPPNGESRGAWSGKGATLPAGTKLRMSHNGKLFSAVIDNGTWLANGERHTSASAAASAMTGVSLNGWIYWEAQFPGTDRWQPISKFRSAVARRTRR
jgi:hypothetical protein